MIAICVTFKIKPGLMEDFMPAMRVQATTSLRDEPGCHRFDIAAEADDENEVFLYELYADRDAFQTHMGSAHYAAFNAAVTDLIDDKKVSIYGAVTEA